jgi:hypothetical protein
VSSYVDQLAADPATALTDADEAWRLCETLRQLLTESE